MNYYYFAFIKVWIKSEEDNTYQKQMEIQKQKRLEIIAKKAKNRLKGEHVLQ